jgi:hypothetical protein
MIAGASTPGEHCDTAFDKTKEAPMNGITRQLLERDLDSGDRIHIQQGRRPIPDLVGQAGTIVEVFRVPRGSCLVRIDGDPVRQREWFFYRDEVATSAV